MLLFVYECVPEVKRYAQHQEIMVSSSLFVLCVAEVKRDTQYQEMVVFLLA